MNSVVNITTPVARLVQGSLYTSSDKNFDGTQRLFKPGHPKAGQPDYRFYFAVAIPKTPGAQAFWQEPWGLEIYKVGAAGHPQAVQRPDFAWKIIDGDSAIPNKGGSIPKDQPGFAGCWVMRFTSTFAPRDVYVDRPAARRTGALPRKGRNRSGLLGAGQFQRREQRAGQQSRRLPQSVNGLSPGIHGTDHRRPQPCPGRLWWCAASRSQQDQP